MRVGKAEAPDTSRAGWHSGRAPNSVAGSAGIPSTTPKAAPPPAMDSDPPLPRRTAAAGSFLRKPRQGPTEAPGGATRPGAEKEEVAPPGYALWRAPGGPHGPSPHTR